MSNKVVRAIIPTAPMSYDIGYLNQLARALDDVITAQRNPVINLSNIPSDGVANGLEQGDLYEANGFLKIVRRDDIFSGTTLGTAVLGSVIAKANADVAATTNVADGLVGSVTVVV